MGGGSGAEHGPAAGTAIGSDDGGTRGGGPRAGRNPGLGIVALVIAVLTFVLMPITTVLVNRPEFIDQAGTISATVMIVQLLGMSLAVGLGVVAAVTRRGRAWGITALAVVGAMVLMALAGALTSLLGGGASTPVR